MLLDKENQKLMLTDDSSFVKNLQLFPIVFHLEHNGIVDKFWQRPPGALVKENENKSEVGSRFLHIDWIKRKKNSFSKVFYLICAIKEICDGILSHIKLFIHINLRKSDDNDYAFDLNNLCDFDNTSLNSTISVLLFVWIFCLPLHLSLKCQIFFTIFKIVVWI